MKIACGNGDYSCSLYVNGSYQGEDAIGRLMHDFGCKESKDIYYPELAEGVNILKKKEVESAIKISENDKEVLLKRL